MKRASRGLMAAGLAFAFASCAGSGDVAEAPKVVDDGSVAGCFFRFQDPGDRLKSHEEALRAAFARVLPRAAELLDVRGTTFTVVADRLQTIPGFGLGGRTFGPRVVVIAVDPAFADLTAVLPERAAYLIAHELHHAARFRGAGYGTTLREAIVSEGLADRFAVELLMTPPQPWSVALPPDVAGATLERARAAFDAPRYDHAKWFFGTDASIPRWAGYALGFEAVGTYAAARGGAGAAHLVNVPARDILP